MAQPIEFFFDFSSPYGYIASHLIDRAAAKHGRSVVWKPILLGAIFKTTGGAPLVDYPVKRDYAQRDFERSARLHGIAWRMPNPFPFSSVAASRAFYWLEASDPAKACDLARALYDGAFAKGGNISAADEVAAIAADLGVARDALLAGIQTPEVKDKVRAENDAALARGVFGSPYFIVDGEPFWGADRLGEVERWAEGGW